MRTPMRVWTLFVCLVAPLEARQSALSLPSLDRSAAAWASGEAGASLSGLDAIGVNPAGVFTDRREWNATYRPMPLDTNVSGTAIEWPVDALRASFAVSYVALRSSNLEQRTPTGEPAGSFRQEDQMVGLHAAHPFSLGKIQIAGGIGLKAIRSRIDRYSGSGYAVDLGLRHRFPESPITVAVEALNLGRGPMLRDERSALPTSYGGSAALRVSDSFVFFGGASYQSGQDLFSASVGGEYRFGDLLSLRGHYAAGTDDEGNSGLGRLSGGVGLLLGSCRLDYAFQPTGEELSQAGAPPTQHATLTLVF